MKIKKNIWKKFEKKNTKKINKTSFNHWWETKKIALSNLKTLIIIRFFEKKKNETNKLNVNYSWKTKKIAISNLKALIFVRVFENNILLKKFK